MKNITVILPVHKLNDDYKLMLQKAVESAKELLERGFRTLLLLDPEYIDPASRPDNKNGRKSWDDIQAEIDKQQEMFAEDPRI